MRMSENCTPEIHRNKEPGVQLVQDTGYLHDSFKSWYNTLHIRLLIMIYRTRAVITRGLYTFYPLFEVHLCTVTFGLMYG